MNRSKKNLIFARVAIAVSICIVAIMRFVLKQSVTFPIVIVAIMSFAVIYLIYSTKNEIVNNNSRIENIIKVNEKEALEYSKVGLITYDDDFKVTAESEMFTTDMTNHIGESILVWIPALQELINGNVDEVEIIEEERKFTVKKVKNEQILLFKDITEAFDLKKKIKDESIVFGMINFDNYADIVDFDNENNGFVFNAKQQVIDYLKFYKIVFKQYRSDRLFLILDETIFTQLLNDRFSIVSTIRQSAKKADLPLTLSMAFVKDHEDRVELDERLQELMDLAVSRGGDQVVVKSGDNEVEYHGGTSEAYENKSKIKVRAIANSLKDLIQNSDNVLIVGHENQDSDCVASSVMMSKLAKRFNKDVAIINKNISMDPMIQSVLEKYKVELNEEHEFISINEAVNRLRENTLVIMVDHHYTDNTSAKQIVEEAKKVVIIDHHRRRAELLNNTALVYIEPAASSASELVVEFIPYLLKRGALTKQEANLAYLGILIDTNRFKQRVGSRTFDVLSMLKQFGADPVECDELNVSNIDDVLEQSKLVSRAEVRGGKYIVTCGKETEIFNRTTISKASDELAYAKDTYAAFAIAKINEETVAISARSNRKMNVQLIMEKLGGGGHLTMAGVQKVNVTIEELKKQLIDVVDEYFKELENESNIA